MNRSVKHKFDSISNQVNSTPLTKFKYYTLRQWYKLPCTLLNLIVAQQQQQNHKLQGTFNQGKLSIFPPWAS